MAVVFGMVWATPVLQAVCSPSPHTLPEHCGTSVPSEHCDEMEGMEATLCVPHRARQDFRKTNDWVAWGGEAIAAENREEGAPEIQGFSVVLPRRTSPRVGRRHAHVGVWLE